MAGMGIGQIIAWIGSLAVLVLGIMVGVKILQKQGTGLGVLAIILAIFCVLPTLIWGWIKAKEFGMQKLMMWYTIAFVVASIGNIISGAAIFGALMGSPEMQEIMQESQSTTY